MILEKQSQFVFYFLEFIHLLHFNCFLFGEEAGLREELTSISRMGP